MHILVFQMLKQMCCCFNFYQLRDLQHGLQLHMNLLAGSSLKIESGQQLIINVRWSEKSQLCTQQYHSAESYTGCNPCACFVARILRVINAQYLMSLSTPLSSDHGSCY